MCTVKIDMHNYLWTYNEVHAQVCIRDVPGMLPEANTDD